jgi:DNA-binding CsgD family transcriptional regulator
VLSLLALGHTNREIGNLLAISARTAESHRLSIMTKLRLRSRSQLVLYALSRGLIGPG